MSVARACAAALLFAGAVAGQSEEGVATSRSVDLARLVERANHQNPYLGAQASKALEKHGVSALPALVAFVERRSIYALSVPVTTWLGELDDDRARKLLTRSAFDREFPWRPYAVRALAKTPRAEDRKTFRKLTEDPLMPVREAAAEGLGRLGVPDDADDSSLESAGLRALLGDSSFDVRAAAALTLAGRGDKSGVTVMVEALDLSRRFFDLDFGDTARRRAWALVEPEVGVGASYDPGAPPELRRVWIAAIRARLSAAAEAAPSSPSSRPAEVFSWAPDATDVVFGLEVRNCRRGDAFVRLTAAGELVSGQYDLRRAAVPAPLRAELLAAIETVRGIPQLPLYGRPGCDFERYYVPDESGLIKLTVGLEGRPAAAARLSALLWQAVDECFGGPAGDDHLERVAPFAAFGDDD